MSDANIAIIGAPHDAPEGNEIIDRNEAVAAAIVDSGGTVTEVEDANGAIWLDRANPADLQTLLDEHPGISWVQLPSAGIEAFVTPEILSSKATITCAKGAYAEEVAEHALMLTLTVLRDSVRQIRSPHWMAVEPATLHRKRVTILGGGGIATEYVRLIEPFNCHVRVLRRSTQPLEGVNETLHISQLHEVLGDTDVLVLALALTAENRKIISEKELSLLPSHAVLVNIARGAHVDTDALTESLQSKSIAGAGLDVTDPEPLPQGHALWSMDNVMITSHSADSYNGCTLALAKRVGDNVRQLVSGADFIGVVDRSASY